MPRSSLQDINRLASAPGHQANRLRPSPPDDDLFEEAHPSQGDSDVFTSMAKPFRTPYSRMLRARNRHLPYKV